MYRCLLWGTGKDFAKYINLVHYHELRGDIRVMGITSDSCLYKSVMGYRFVGKDEIPYMEIDLIIIMAENMLFDIEREIRERGMAGERMPLFLKL